MQLPGITLPILVNNATARVLRMRMLVGGKFKTPTVVIGYTMDHYLRGLGGCKLLQYHFIPNSHPIDNSYILPITVCMQLLGQNATYTSTSWYN